VDSPNLPSKHLASPRTTAAMTIAPERQDQHVRKLPQKNQADFHRRGEEDALRYGHRLRHDGGLNA